MATPTLPRIPGSIDDITSEWVEMALQRTAPGCRVESIAVQRIGEGVGFLGELARVGIVYSDNPQGGAPASVIVKLPTNVPEPRAMATGMGFYEREIGFYRELSHRAGPRVPTCYYVEDEPATGSFVLVMEDFPGAQAGDQLASCTDDQARLAVRELAKLHARWWQSPELDSYSWLPNKNHPFVQVLKGAHQQFLAVFEEHWADRFDPMVLRVARGLAEKYDDFIDALMSMPLTLAHQDYRLDNVLFGEPGTPEELVILDWQLAQQSPGLMDLQYFIAGNLRRDARKRLTDELVDLYYEGLRQNGVKDYTFEQCKDNFVRASTTLGFYVVTGAATLNADAYNERGHELIDTLFGSLNDAMVEYEAERWLPA